MDELDWNEPTKATPRTATVATITGRTSSSARRRRTPNAPTRYRSCAMTRFLSGKLNEGATVVPGALRARRPLAQSGLPPAQ